MRYAALLLAALLAACATQGPAGPGSSSAAMQPAVQAFAAEGRISLR